MDVVVGKDIENEQDFVAGAMFHMLRGGEAFGYDLYLFHLHC